MMSADRLPTRQMMTIDGKNHSARRSEQYFSRLSDEGLVRSHFVQGNQI